jgi:hypothetical protein
MFHLTLEIPENGTLFRVPMSTVEYQIGHDQKIIFFSSRTSASVIKLQNVLGKIHKITKKGFIGEILQGLYFDLPNFDWFGHICEAKNFFFLIDDTHFSQFSKLPNISKNVLGPKSKQKSEPKERRHFSE